MFTGLVQGMGTIRAVESRGAESRLRISPDFALHDYQAGESIAINGVCLTVEQYGTDWFSAYASAETMGLTNLGRLTTGSSINLERALALGDRLGGHLVSGHVDCTAVVASISPAGESKLFRLSFPTEFGPQVIAKGSVALDGISLTVNACGPDFLEVNIIPATQGETTIAKWKPGTMVNMETDLIGKYVQNMLGPWDGGRNSAQTKPSSMSLDFLHKHGF
jgi:riboflavin synthase